MRKVYLELKVKMIIHISEGDFIYEFVDELDYEFKDTTGNVTIEDTQIIDFEVTDSR
jgi:hypothetical protein